MISQKPSTTKGERSAVKSTKINCSRGRALKAHAAIAGCGERAPRSFMPLGTLMLIRYLSGTALVQPRCNAGATLVQSRCNAGAMLVPFENMVNEARRAFAVTDPPWGNYGISEKRFTAEALDRSPGQAARARRKT